MKRFVVFIFLSLTGILFGQDKCDASYYNQGGIGHILISNQEVYSGNPVLTIFKPFSYKDISYIPAEVSTHASGQGFVHEELSYVIFQCNTKTQVAEFAIEATTIDLKSGKAIYRHTWKADFTTFTLLDLQSNAIQMITLDDPKGFYPVQDTIGPVFDLQGDIKLTVTESKNTSGQYIYTYVIQNNTNYSVTRLEIGNIQKPDNTESCELASIPGEISVGEEIDDPALNTPIGWTSSFSSCDGTNYVLSIENEDAPISPTNKITIATITLTHADSSYLLPHFSVYFAESHDDTTMFNGIAVSSNLLPKKRTIHPVRNKKQTKKQTQNPDRSHVAYRKGSNSAGKSPNPSELKRTM